MRQTQFLCFVVFKSIFLKNLLAKSSRGLVWHGLSGVNNTVPKPDYMSAVGQFVHCCIKTIQRYPYSN